VVVALGVAFAADPGEAPWPSIALGPELARVSSPACITHAGDASGRVFVAQRDGRIVVFAAEGGKPELFLDIAGRVSARDGGIRGLAFPYDFVDKRCFFVSYLSARRELVIARYRLAAGTGTGDAATEQVLLRVVLPQAERPGGGIAIGADSKLYVGVGEGVAARDSRGEAQDRGSLLGKILRIDVTSAAAQYAVPTDNPWAKTQGARGEIWAMGLGNPSWLGFDEESGDLFIADSLGAEYEEIDVQPGSSLGGDNFGWNTMEGMVCRTAKPCDDAGLTKPVAVLARKKGAELTGGALPGSVQRPQFDGISFFLERRSGRLWGLRRVDNGNWRSQALSETPAKIAALGAGENGEVYVADARTGAIRQVVLAPANREQQRSGASFGTDGEARDGGPVRVGRVEHGGDLDSVLRRSAVPR
jgi:hypothetical protein